MTRTDLPTVILATASADEKLADALGAALARFESQPLDAVTATAAAVTVFDGRENVDEALLACRTLRARLGDGGLGIIFLAGDDATARVAYSHGADVSLVHPAADAVVAQVKACLRRQQSIDRLNAKANEAREINVQLQHAYDQLNLDLEMARRLQSSFLPKTFPELGGVRFAVHHRPHGPVGGDCYDAFRLDERHVGFYLADAMGHGVPAGLLTIYVKKAVTAKEIIPGGYRLLPPDEVLSRLNRDLIAQNLPEQPFLTMIYGLVDCFSGELRVARAAHPFPIYISRPGGPTVWEMPGTLLGIFEASFKTQTRTLHVGDRLLLLTDGLSAEVAEPSDADPGPVLGACRAAQGLDCQAFVDEVAARLLIGVEPRDDFTLLALDFGG